MKRFYDHPAVTPEYYANRLNNFGYNSTQDPTFSFLLKEADQDDLNAVKKNEDMSVDQMNSRRRLKMLFSLPSQVEIDRIVVTTFNEPGLP